MAAEVEFDSDIKTEGKFVKKGGTAAQFLKADGSVDSNTYAKETDAIKNQTAVLENKSFRISGNGQAGTLQIDNSFFSKTYYNFSNGFFIQTDIPENGNAMVTLEIIGNSYSTTDPINTKIQCYSYNNSSILSYSGINNGFNIYNVEIFVYNGFLCFWLAQQNSSTTLRFVLTTHVGYFKITSVTNVAKPVSGTSRDVTVNPTNIVTNNLLTQDLNNVKTPGFYTGLNVNATTANNYPVNGVSGILKVYKSLYSGVYLIQEFTTYNTGTTYKRVFTGSWSSWITIWDSTNFNSNNTYALSSNVISKQVLSGRVLSDANAVTAGSDFFYLAGSNKPANSTDGALQSLSYNGSSWFTQMYSDWRTNEWYVRVKNNGVWSVWSNLWSSKHFSQSNINNWNAIAGDGIKLNTPFTYSSGYGLQIADHPLDSACGMYDPNFDIFLAGSCNNEYWKFCSTSDGFDGINISKYNRNIGIGTAATDNDKLLVDGSIKTTSGIKSPNENHKDFFAGSGEILSADTEIINEGSRVRLNVMEYHIQGYADLYLNDDSRLIRIFGYESKMKVDLETVYRGQEIVIYHNGDPEYNLNVMLYGNYIFELLPGECVRLFVNANNDVYAERRQPFEVYN